MASNQADSSGAGHMAAVLKSKPCALSLFTSHPNKQLGCSGLTVDRNEIYIFEPMLRAEGVDEVEQSLSVLSHL